MSRPSSGAGKHETFVSAALQTPEAKQALGEGFASLLLTRDPNTAWKAMIEAGQRNGSLAVVQVALLFDVLKAIADFLNNE